MKSMPFMSFTFVCFSIVSFSVVLMNVVSTLVRFMSVIVSSYENFLPSMVVLFTLPVRGFFLGGSFAAADLGVTLAYAYVTLVESRA